jgi:DNA-binding SARP family transcriptional activator
MEKFPFQADQAADNCGTGRGTVASLKVTLLGGFAARDSAGAEPGPLGRKAQAILAVLALNPGAAHSRDKLTALLWGDRGESQARGSLRAALSELRKALGHLDPPPLIAERETVRIDPNAVEIDAVTFERLAGEETDEALARATELYGGDLLDGFHVREPGFDDWLRVERERLRGLAVAAFSRLVDRRAGNEAIDLARRLLLLDPLIESTHRTLMKLYGEAGDRRMALSQYEACRKALKDDLGLQPEPETERLHDKIRAGGTTRAGTDIPHNPSTQQLRPFFDMSGEKKMPVNGGCLCGEIRYRITEPAIDMSICHCRMCQRATGGQMCAGQTVSREAFVLTRGELKYYKSSPIAERGFCANCGSSLTYRPLFPPWSDWIDVFAAGLDNPETLSPTWHLGVEGQMPWLDIRSDLPRVRCAESPDLVEAWAYYNLPVP